jgi:blue copper oxidase
MRTAEQVYMGQAGLFYVTDPVEALAVPGASTGANDVPVIIQDRTFDANNQLLYQPNQMWGLLGNRILVNGKPNVSFSLEPHAYRLRILNGSNARTYKLAWSNGMPMQVIGTDGGLLPAVATRPYVMLMPGERVDIWADFSSCSRSAGDPAQPFLRSHGRDDGRWRWRRGWRPMGGGGMGPGPGGGGGGGGMGSAVWPWAPGRYPDRQCSQKGQRKASIRSPAPSQ